MSVRGAAIWAMASQYVAFAINFGVSIYLARYYIGPDELGLFSIAFAATTLIAFGRAEETVDNAAGAAGDLNVKVRTGVFKWANSSAGDLIANTEIGDTAYIVDDQTVAKTNGGATRSRAGKVVFVESDGVWVQMGPQF